ncbi:MAG: enoyl-CoA hydratase-related protein [Mycetocola sp.]
MSDTSRDVAEPDRPNEVVRSEFDRGIATITLDSPANRNALSQHLLDELARHLAAAKTDNAVRGVVLTGTGSTFCSGADLKAGTVPGTAGTTLPDLMTELWTFPKVVIAKLNGHVRAGGTGLVAAADIVVASRTATFAFSEVRIGVSPAIISVLCARRMNPRALSRFCLLGDTFDADQAVASGLATLAVDPGDLDRATEEILAGIRMAEPNAVRITKDLLREVGDEDIERAFARMETLSREMFASETAQEGMLAFREKRLPRWADAH